MYGRMDKLQYQVYFFAGGLAVEGATLGHIAS